MDIKKTLQEAVLAHKNDNLQKAERIYREILEIHPKQPDANHNLGLLLASNNKNTLGLSLFEIAVKENPKIEQFWISYINALLIEKEFDEAKKYLDIAFKYSLSKSNYKILQKKINASIINSFIPREDIKVFSDNFNNGNYKKAESSATLITKKFPENSFAWKLLASVYQKTGDLIGMLNTYKKIINIEPEDLETLHNYAKILSKLKKYNDAEEVFKRILLIDPDFNIDYFIFANGLLELGKLKEAEKLYRRVISINPNFANAYNNIAVVMKRLKKYEEAKKNFKKSIELNPNQADAHYNIGDIYAIEGDFKSAIECFEKTININPEYEDAYNSLGLTFKEIGKFNDAEKTFKKILKLNPNSIQGYNNLGIILRDLGKFEEAEKILEKAINLSPKKIELYNNLGSAYRSQNNIKMAEKSYRKALEIDPKRSSVLSNILFLQSSNSYNPQTHLKEATNYGKLLTDRIEKPFSEWKCNKNPKRIRIGFVSGDFHNHPVGYFLESILEKIDTSSVQLFAYSTHSRQDDLTERIKPFFFSWKNISYLDDSETAKLIHDDGIHILIDLSGHTDRNRLTMFAWKPAPIQATWLGYWATTGVKEIDYIIGDPYRTPENEENHFTEKVWRLPETSLCFTAPKVNIQPGPLPALSNNFITFGCFNSIIKLTDDVVAIRAKILEAVPNSRLLLKSKEFNNTSGKKRIINKFISHNIQPERLILENFSSREEYLESYNRVDIALSPYPYGGVTTSTEGLWMGVPVLAKKGDRYISHVSESINYNAGLPDWIASDDDEYIAKAIEFSSNTDKLKNIRENLRNQVLSSPLFDSEKFAKYFEEALWGMYKLWENQGTKKVNKVVKDKAYLKSRLKELLNFYEKEDFNNAEKLGIKITNEFPRNETAWEILRIIFKKNGKLEKELKASKKLVKINPEISDYQYNLANTYRSLKEYKKANLIYEKAITLNPDDYKIYNNYGNNLRDLNKFKEAEQIYLKGISLNPNYFKFYNNLGLTLKEMDRFDEAINFYNKALVMGSKDYDTINGLGALLRDLGRNKEAEEIYKKGIELLPNHSSFYSNLGVVLHKQNKHKEAEEIYKKGIELMPNNAALFNNLGANYNKIGETKKAEKNFRKALKADPNQLGSFSNILFLQSQRLENSLTHLKEATNYGKLLTDRIEKPFSEWKCNKNPKRIRIGFVSGDFHNHPVGYFLESILEKIDTSSVQLFAYSTHSRQDDLTERIKPFFFSWKNISYLDDSETAKLIHDDGIHILIDLSGHTDRNRLTMFAWKPAPIQATWLGYWATTGVKEIDYIIGDPYRTPENEENHFTEKVWRLPETSLCFTAPKVNIQPGPLPALSNNFITFGCFNSIIKLTDDVVAIRAKILEAVPNSRLLLKSKEFNNTSGKKRIINKFISHNIQPERLILENFSSREEYLESYNRVDIALSPYPYGGVTTSTEGLWMGVPVLAKKGDRYISHVSESINYNAGLPDWIASDDDEYIAKAIEFSSNTDKLKNIRENLRNQVLSSPLFDSEKFAKYFEEALWGMYKLWENKK